MDRRERPETCLKGGRADFGGFRLMASSRSQGTRETQPREPKEMALQPAPSVEQWAVPTERLCIRCTPAELTAAMANQPVIGVGGIGQERAIHALRDGLGIRNASFNLYVSGVPGTGRMTTARLCVDQIART